VEISPAQAADVLVGHEGVGVILVTLPDAVVLAGEEGALTRALADVRRRYPNAGQRAGHRLDILVHTSHLEPLRADFSLGRLVNGEAPRVPFFSGGTGKIDRGQPLDRDFM